MPLSRPRVSLGLPISIAILLILGSIAGPLIRSNFTEKERAANVFLEAIPFILIFVAIILTFITLIVLVGSRPERQHSPPNAPVGGKSHHLRNCRWRYWDISTLVVFGLQI